jgi:hypothetical protein
MTENNVLKNWQQIVQENVQVPIKYYENCFSVIGTLDKQLGYWEQIHSTPFS